MKLGILCVLLLAMWGCTFPVPNELNYRGELPATTVIGPEIIEHFATRLADETGLEQTSRVHATLPIIELTASGSRDLVVTVMGDKSTNAILVTLHGKIHDDTAKNITGTLQVLFTKMYPEGKLVPYERRGGWFGP